MTPQQKRTLDYVRAYHAEHGRAPTMQEIADATGVKAKSQVSRQLNTLAEYGFLRRTNHFSGKYVPAEVPAVDLAHVPTETLRAELDRRQTESAR
ncbi:helix-turn-helix domain-containing protein [Alteriqipengyuania flavescens]|uniref:LexA family protein n=1 Tax=Alteriqipengyuania flavescens TaxID=3053610 RepID=UPI0025B578D4|nr:helix-turn-helix domain-containing protein [Alteriqipengyuania flavescens]WJY18699.1 helix-turn-helix domain-containing protein [Alteriqipengyuania flavescens]WJY24639.1 helix-turn-helix domain-containing protein [Alteriqipengyuania flavescens]